MSTPDFIVVQADDDDHVIVVYENSVETVQIIDVGPQGMKGDDGDSATRDENEAAVFVGPTAPTATGSYLWVETGLGAGGTGMTIWIEDGQ